MVYTNLRKKSLSMILAMAFAISGCMPSDVPTGRQGFAEATGVGVTTVGAGAGTTSGSTSGSSSGLLPKVEIRHLIEPNLSTDNTYSSGTGFAGGGSYVRKLTLPKNFQGRLYLAGINIGTLADRHVKVRFKFGVGREPVTLSAFVSQAPGITPQTNIHVLVMDMRAEPFRNVRLPYDLFDYNEYGPTDTPVQDNRDTGLYCRGLRLEDDPTFTGVGQCDGLQPNEECLYAYAKVMDQGLVKEVPVTTPVPGVVYVPTVPTLANIKSTAGNGYYQDWLTQQIKKPLADNILGPFKFSENPFPVGSTDAFNAWFGATVNATVPSNFGAFNILNSNYYYRGPYRLVNSGDWHFKFLDLVGTNRLFKSSLNYPGGTGAPAPENNRLYYQSYMFPLATQLDLNTGVSHLASTTWDAPRSETTLSLPGKTQWMDGANARANSKNSELEHIGSCNVSASMEIIAKDNNNNEYVIALSEEVKLQLVRPIQHYTDSGNDVLYSNFKTCTSNATCGGNECCFNNRCWDQTLVSQCFDSSTSQGNKQVGETCLTDLECTSLCCNRTSGLCSPHNTNLTSPVLCSKPIGDYCIAKEWCQKVPIIKCLVVRTGTDALGNTTCRQQCYTTQEYGECKNGMCSPPYQEPITTFDANDPAACANAVPAPNF
jgi:hypothetical protein